MKLPRFATLLCTAALSIPASAAIQQSQTVSVGNSPTEIAVDPVTSRVFVTNTGLGRNQGGSSLVAIEPTGEQRSIPLSAQPLHIALNGALRRAVVSQTNCDCVAVVDLDTLAVRSIPSTVGMVRVVFSETARHAYVLSTGLLSGRAGTGTLTDVDLAANTSTVYPVPAMGVVDMVANADASRLYIVGVDYAGVAQWNAGYVQAFDVASHSLVSSPVRVGRVTQAVMMSTTTGELIVVGHADYDDPVLAVNNPHPLSMMPTVFVLDAASLSLKRSIAMPYTTNLALFGPQRTGAVDMDPATGAVYALDTWNKRFSIVDPVQGTLSVIDTESEPQGIAVNRVTGTVGVSLNRAGQVAIYSPAGARLDTVPIAPPPVYGTQREAYAMSVDSRGNTYVANSSDNTISILPRATGGAQLVNFTDVWSDPADPGWGVFLQQQGALAFAALFIHDAAGSPTWVVMPHGSRQLDGSFSGEVYRTMGPVGASGPASVALVGTMRFAAIDLSTATLAYTVDGGSVTKEVSRLPIGSALRTCAWSVSVRKSSPSASTNYTSLWWNPAQPGWGLAVSNQGSVAFGVLFGYDAANKPTWSVMADGLAANAGTFGGTLYRSASGDVQAIGDMSLSFTSSDDGTLGYRIDGVTQSSPVVREEFASPSSRCSS